MSRNLPTDRPVANRSNRGHGKVYQIEGISIDTVAARAGVTVRRVQYLEREGLVTPLDSSSGARFYDESAVERIQLVERLMADLGVNLPGAEVILHMRERMFMMLEEIDRLRRI